MPFELVGGPANGRLRLIEMVAGPLDGARWIVHDNRSTFDYHTLIDDPPPAFVWPVKKRRMRSGLYQVSGRSSADGAELWAWMGYRG